MMSIGEFSIIIVLAAKPLLSAASYNLILALAFALVFVTTALAPLIFNRRQAIAAFFERVFPRPLRALLHDAGQRGRALEALSRSRLFQLETTRLLESVLANVVIVTSISYLASLAHSQFPSVSNLIAVPIVAVLVAWPVYKVISDLRYLFYLVFAPSFARLFPRLEHRLPVVADLVVDFTASLFFSLFGLLAVLVGVMLNLPALLLTPIALFAALLILYAARSLYALVEHAAAVETQAEAEASGVLSRDAVRLSREFNEHGELFRALHAERLRTQDRLQEHLLRREFAQVNRLLSDFKRLETQTALGLVSAEHLPSELRKPWLSIRGTNVALLRRHFYAHALRNQPFTLATSHLPPAVPARKTVAPAPRKVVVRRPLKKKLVLKAKLKSVASRPAQRKPARGGKAGTRWGKK